MWSFHRGQLYNRLGGRLALLNRTEARLVHWPENVERKHRSHRGNRHHHLTIIENMKGAEWIRDYVYWCDESKNSSQGIHAQSLWRVYNRHKVRDGSHNWRKSLWRCFLLHPLHKGQQRSSTPDIYCPACSMYAECSRKREDKQYFIDCNLIESLVHLHTTHRKCKKWVLDSYDTGVQTTKENNKNVLIFIYVHI